MCKFTRKIQTGKFSIKNLNVKSDIERIFIPFFKKLYSQHLKGLSQALNNLYLDQLRHIIVNSINSISNILYEPNFINLNSFFNSNP